LVIPSILFFIVIIISGFHCVFSVIGERGLGGRGFVFKEILKTSEKSPLIVVKIKDLK